MVNDVVARETDMANASHFFKATSTSQQQNFGDFMAALDNREQTDGVRESSTERDNSRRTQREADDRRDRSERAERADRNRADNRRRTENARRTERTVTQEPQDEAIVVDCALAAQPEYEYGDVQQDELMENLAMLIQVPPELIKKILDEMGLKPEDLLDPQNANLFLQKLLGKTGVELLNMPEYPLMIENLSKGMEQLLTAQVPEALEKLAKTFAVLGDFQATLDEHNQLVIEELGEGQIVEAEELDDALLQQNNSENSNANNTQAQQQATTQTIIGAEETENEIIPMQDNTTIDQPQINPAGLQAEIVAERVAKATVAATQAQTDPVKVMEQIIDRIKVLPADGFSEIRLMLKPETLGEVALRIATLNGIVTAMFVAENQRVKEIIESNLSQLRDSLQEQGLEVSELHVSVGQGDAEERMNQYLKAQQEAFRRAQRLVTNVAGTEGEEAEATPAPISDGRSTVEFSA